MRVQLELFLMRKCKKFNIEEKLSPAFEIFHSQILQFLRIKLVPSCTEVSSDWKVMYVGSGTLSHTTELSSPRNKPFLLLYSLNFKYI